MQSAASRRGRSRAIEALSIPTRQARPSRRGPETARSPPKFTSTGSEVICAAAASAWSTAYSLPMPPKSISMPGSKVSTGRCQRTRDQPTSGSTRRISRSEGARVPPSNFHARRRTPLVMSNFPSDRRHRCSAKSSRLRGFFVDLDGLSGGAIDPRDDVVVAVAAELLFDAPCAGGDRASHRLRQLLVDGVHEHFARAAHGAKSRSAAAPRRSETEVIAELQDHRVEIRHLRRARLVADQHWSGALPIW